MDDDDEELRDVEFRQEEHLVEELIEPVNHRDADLGDDFGPEEHPIEEPSDDIRRAEELAVEWVDSLKHKDIESVEAEEIERLLENAHSEKSGSNAMDKQ